jgi:hypothetical protein
MKGTQSIRRWKSYFSVFRRRTWKQVVAQKSVIASQYANDFSGACNYFLAQVSRLHGRA